MALDGFTPEYLGSYFDHKKGQYRTEPVDWLLSHHLGDRHLNPATVSDTLKRIGEAALRPQQHRGHHSQRRPHRTDRDLLTSQR